MSTFSRQFGILLRVSNMSCSYIFTNMRDMVLFYGMNVGQYSECSV